MATASWEEASRCPRCSQPGNDFKVARVTSGRMRGGVTHVLKCENERCKWYNTSWVVTVGPNGEIPIRSAGPKDFPEITPGQASYARRMIEQLAVDDPALMEAVQEFLEGQ